MKRANKGWLYGRKKYSRKKASIRDLIELTYFEINIQYIKYINNTKKKKKIEPTKSAEKKGKVLQIKELKNEEQKN